MIQGCMTSARNSVTPAAGAQAKHPRPRGFDIDPETGEIKRLWTDKTFYSESRKHNAFWARMRQDLKMCERSPDIEDYQVDDIRTELSDILDSGFLIYPPTLDSFGIDMESTLEERKKSLGLLTIRSLPTPEEQRFQKFMALKAESGRKSNWQWRISQEAQEKQAAGWYPFFVTLTVDPYHPRFKKDHQKHREGVTCPKELWQNGREFRLYIRSLVNIVCKELGHRPAHKTNIPESEYVTYAGIVEHGKSREHHHGHFMLWMREIPNSWKQCPNRFVKNPANRRNNECIQMRNIWQWSLPGLSPVNYYRTIGDVWSRQGFVLPLKDGQPMKITNVCAAGAYITKYLQKEHKEWLHRVKATRNIGLKTLKRVISKLKLKTLLALTWRPKTYTTNHLTTMIHTVPLGLLRSLTKQEHFFRIFKANQLDLKELIQPVSEHYQMMLSSVRSGIRPDRMHSQEFYDWVSRFLPDQKGYSDEKLLAAHEQLREYYPVENKSMFHQSIAGNNYGLAFSI